MISAAYFINRSACLQFFLKPKVNNVSENTNRLVVLQFMNFGISFWEKPAVSLFIVYHSLCSMFTKVASQFRISIILSLLLIQHIMNIADNRLRAKLTILWPGVSFTWYRLEELIDLSSIRVHMPCTPLQKITWID